jgi:uncharacterized flavoprotein (TIGR03862 family)
MRSVGRKFLVAGKSGLNLTNAAGFEEFMAQYRGTDFPVDLWRSILANFDNTALRNWAAELGIDTFAAKSGKVFPVPVDGKIRAAPLLRRWIEKLRRLGVIFQTRHRWIGFDYENRITFQHDDDAVTRRHDAVVLALGGGSWPQTGSDGSWVEILEGHGMQISPLTAANCGWEVDWPPALLNEAEGLPLKNLLLASSDQSMSQRGELMITRYGLEGGPIYHVGPALRSMPAPEIVIDFKPDFSLEELVSRMGAVKRNFVREARRRWKLDPGTAALLKHLPDRGPWKSAEQLSQEVKHCRISLTHPRPIAEAISSAGGVDWSELDENLMLNRMPGVFVVGEMLDWEAPTGGYLLQGCFATGDWAGRAVAAYQGSEQPE